MSPPTAATICQAIVDPACVVRIRPARDILFLVDISSAAPNFKAVLVSYVQMAYCAFGQGAGSRVGFISFGSNVQVALPLATRTPDDFAATISTLAQTLATNNEVTRPVAEALELAYTELTKPGQNSERLVVFFSVGPPNPVPLVSGSTSQAHVPAYGYPFASRYYAYMLCVTSDSGSCVKMAIHDYLGVQVPTSMNKLRALANTSFAAVLIPPRSALVANGLSYYSAIPEYVSGPACTYDAQCTGACNWCKAFFNPITQLDECHCATLTAPMFSAREILNSGGTIQGLNDTIVSVCNTFPIATNSPSLALGESTPSPAQSLQGSGDSSSLGPGTLAGIIVVVLALAALALFLFFRRRRALHAPDQLRRRASQLAERRASMAPSNPVFRNETAGLSPHIKGDEDVRVIGMYRPQLQDQVSEWSQSYDPNTGAVFWANRVTGEFSWSTPSSGAAPPPSSRRKPVAANPIFAVEAQSSQAARDEVAAAKKRKKSFTVRYLAPVMKQEDPNAGWEEAVDPTTNLKYWRNTITGEFSWNRSSASDQGQGQGHGENQGQGGPEGAPGSNNFEANNAARAPIAATASTAETGTMASAMSSALSSALRPTLRSRMQKKKDAPTTLTPAQSTPFDDDEPDFI